MSSSTTPNPSNVATPPTTPTKAAPAAQGVTSQPGVDSGAEVQPKTSSSSAVASSPIIQVPLAAFCTLAGDDYGAGYDFRSHERVQLLMQIFACVEVVSVKSTISVDKCFAIPKEGLRNYKLRHGIAPRTTNFWTKKSDGTYTGLGAVTARLVSTSMNPMFPTPATSEFNSKTFPPGLQTDLRAVETRHPYINYVVINDDAVKENTNFSFCVQIDFIVECSGENFGVVGL